MLITPDTAVNGRYQAVLLTASHINLGDDRQQLRLSAYLCELRTLWRDEIIYYLLFLIIISFLFMQVTIHGGGGPSSYVHEYK